MCENIERNENFYFWYWIYVGLSNAILLAQHNEVVALDVVPEKINQLNNRQSPIRNMDMQQSKTCQN